MRKKSNKKMMIGIALLLMIAMLFVSACSPTEETEEVEVPEEPAEMPEEAEEEVEEIAFASEPPVSGFNNGTYRGTYGDRGDQQVSVQFTLTDGVISNLGYRHLYYGEADYRQMDEEHPMYPVKLQHEQIASYLEGKTLEDLEDLYEPENFVEDVDTFSGATIRANKVYSAIQDGLNRGVYSPSEPVYKVLEGPYDDGTYRGLFEDGGFQQLGVQFDLKDGMIHDVRFRQLYYGETDHTRIEEGDPMYPVKVQHEQMAAYLEGKPVDAIFDLFNPKDFVEDVDTFSGATIRGNKMFSAMKDALNRGVYSPANSVTKDIGPYPDGRYRGVFSDGGTQQVGIQFYLEEGMFTDLSFRRLNYAGIDFMDIDEEEEMYPVLIQHEQVLEYLEGKSLETVFDLYEPGDFVEDIDTYTGATLRGNKVLSAIRDGLNRGIY
ncbi:hypothetical protein SAMN05192551_103227 [Tindallia magadiensis]|uniref:FMN-binding domain-containing protein n=1 Tax=Tindallia magadiensis TaxID=69895 RepID=A0A1I3DB94_9FIRM|nr:FMN-binding protein [Tindallia magadiensis]SFH83973.1 hypothetical protein SAMN05192551_103227 [Tindallia magadiensis]